MSESRAWLLNLGEDIYVAVGKRELRYLVADLPRFTAIPKTPPHCCKVFVWQGAILPVMDIAQRILARPVQRQSTEELIVLATFQAHKAAPLQHGALLLGAIPLDIQVEDTQVCPLPEPSNLWQTLAQACFQHEQYGPVPILDLAQVFLTASTDDKAGD